MNQIYRIRLFSYSLLALATASAAAQTPVTEKKDSLQGNLKEVTVSAERSAMHVKDGRLSYDLNRLAKHYTVDNAWEALAKLPGVTEKEGTYQLTGRDVTVILNGKPTTMTADQLATLLKNTPVNRVERVEVMNSAPPQYHIRGAAINVILKQNRNYSVQGEVTADYLNRFFSYGKAGGTLQITSPKVSLDIMYNLNRGKNIQTVDLYSHHTLPDKVYDIRQFQELRGKQWSHDLRTALDWHISGKNDLSLAYTTRLTPNHTRNNVTTGDFQTSHVDYDGNNYLHNLSLSYTSGFGFQAGADYTRYKLHENQLLDASFNDGSTTRLQADNGQKADRYKFYADQSFKLARNWTLGFGGSYTYATDRDYQIYSQTEGNTETENTASDLKEHTGNVYVSIGKTYTTGTSFSVSATSESYKLGSYHRWSVYPQASLTLIAAPSHIFQLELSTDKTYPSYWNMQSSVSYIDGYSEMRGTPGLLPYMEYSATASYIFRQKYVFSVFYNRSNDYFQQSAWQADDRLVLVYQFLNWNYSQKAGMQISLPFTVTKWYNTRATFIGMHMHQRADHYFDMSFDRRKFVGVISWTNSFKAGKHLLFNLDGVYQSPVIQGTYDVESVLNISASARYTFAGGKAYISLRCNDIFNSGIPMATVRYGRQYFDMDTGRYNRSVGIHFSYRFGNYKKKEVKNVDTSRFGH